MRVLHVITGLAAGGAEQQLHQLVRQQGATAEVATLTNPGIVARDMRMDGFVVHEIGMRGNRDLSALPRLVHLIRVGRYDLVHTHLYRACVYGRVAARLAGVRNVVATEHSLGDRHIEGRRITPAVRRLYLATERLGQVTIAVSAAVARRLARWGVPPDRIVTVPNGIEAGRYRFDPARRRSLRAGLGLAPERFVVGTVGRLVASKRTDAVLRAMRDLDGVTALVVGDGPTGRELVALGNRLEVDARFTGESADVPGVLSTMDLLVSPSAEETFGLGVLEALVAGLPVLFVECPALDELPAGSVPTARRVSADPDAIRRAVADVVHDRPGRFEPPEALSRYDMASVAARIQQVYERVIR